MHNSSHENLLQNLLPVYVSPKAIAEAYGVSSRTVTRHCQEGLIRGAVKTSEGGEWRIPLDSAKEYMNGEK